MYVGKHNTCLGLLFVAYLMRLQVRIRTNSNSGYRTIYLPFEIPKPELTELSTRHSNLQSRPAHESNIVSTYI